MFHIVCVFHFSERELKLNREEGNYSLFFEEKTRPGIYCNFELHVYENDLKEIKNDFIL